MLRSNDAERYDQHKSDHMLYHLALPDVNELPHARARRAADELPPPRVHREARFFPTQGLDRAGGFVEDLAPLRAQILHRLRGSREIRGDKGMLALCRSPALLHLHTHTHLLLVRVHSSTCWLLRSRRRRRRCLLVCMCRASVHLTNVGMKATRPIVAGTRVSRRACAGVLGGLGRERPSSPLDGGSSLHTLPQAQSPSAAEHAGRRLASDAARR